MVGAPYLGPLRLGSTGESVVMLKRALRAAGLLPGSGRPTGLLGPFTARALVNLGNAKVLPLYPRRRLRTFRTSGVYGPRAHVKLAPYYDAYGRARLNAIQRARWVAYVQAVGVAACNLVIANAPAIHYTQSALRMSGVRDQRVPPAFGDYEDCSSEATWIAWLMDRAARRFGGGFADPNGLGYDGQGFTGTQLQHGVPVNAYAGPPAFTFVFYYEPISHVGVKKSTDSIMSHGGESGPLDLPVGYTTPTTARQYPLTLPKVAP